ncbi:MAG: hypothetical protein EOO73_34225 [Myxococcales bacterium]|nr:MAG: hypothetical protein EOO73_34225 [Myxococcales bacterium]
MTIADLIFDTGQLQQCDEVVGATSKVNPILAKLREQLAKSKDDNELVVEKGCLEATSNRPHQATCTEPQLTTYYYDSSAVKGSDRMMKACLKGGGTWKTNDTREAELDALERKMNSPEHQALRKRVLDMASE